jgi:hypothetical protein
VPGARKRREWCRCGNGATERKKEIQARGRKGCKGVGGSGAICTNEMEKGEVCSVQGMGQRCKVLGRGGGVVKGARGKGGCQVREE